MDIKKLTIKATRELFEKKETTPEELRQEFLKAIKKENPELNAYLTVFDAESETQSAGSEGKSLLAGIASAIKDNILIDGTRTTAASKILENYIATYDAHVIKN